MIIETFININEEKNKYFHPSYTDKHILIFLEGTVILNIFNDKEETYIPIGNCIDKIISWSNQGFIISYATLKKNLENIERIKYFMETYNFPGNYLRYRNKYVGFKDIIEGGLPEIIIYDNKKKVTWKNDISICKHDFNNEKMKQIVVKENEGIDSLPNSIRELLNYF